MSICIPTSNMKNKGDLFIRCINSLWSQSFQDFEIVVTDNSDDDVIETLCKFYRTGISYYRNPNKGMAQNTNEAIKRSKGNLVKILYMDDYLAHDNSLKKILNGFVGDWLVSACTHNTFGENYTHNVHYAEYCDNIYTGNNTIGSPSVLTIRNSNPLLFDEKMTWLLDCDYYKRAYDKYGKPDIIKDINVIIGLHPFQATHTMGEEVKRKEHEYIIKKYANTK